MLRLAEIEVGNFQGQYATELTMAVRGHPERRHWEVLSQIFSMHRRHGEAVTGVLRRAAAGRGSAGSPAPMDPTSLLPLILASLEKGDSVGPIAFQVRELEELPISDDASAPIYPLRVRLRMDLSPPRAHVLGLGEIEGAHVRLVGVLRPIHDEAVRKYESPDRHGYVFSGRLATLLDVGKTAVHLYAKRCRDELAEQYVAVGDGPPDQPLLVENRRPQGYRLDPLCRFVDAAPAGSDQQAPGPL